MSGTPIELLAEMKAQVSYLRVDARRDADDDLEWLSCAELVNDGERLLDVVRSTAAGRGTDRDDIAISLFAQAYAFRIASIAIGASLLGERVLDVRPANTAIALGRHRPNAVAMNHVKFGSGSLNELLFDQHLSLFVATAHDVAATAADNRIGKALLWGNVATGCAAAFGAFGQAGPTAAAFFANAPEAVRSAGQYVEATIDPASDEQGEPTYHWTRNSCCLWFQVPNDTPFFCEDCPRKPAS